jgi:hypothetical protein
MTLQYFADKVSSFLKEEVAEDECFLDDSGNNCSVFINLPCKLWRGVHKYGIEFFVLKSQSYSGSYWFIVEIPTHKEVVWPDEPAV